MSDAPRQERSDRSVGKLLSYSAGIVLIASALIVISLKIYLATPYPARQISALLGDYLRQPVTVQLLQMSGPGLHLMGLSIADPAGFPAGSLVTAKSLAIVPNWSRLLRGRRDFTLIELDGLQVDLHKNGAGIWNFSGLRQLFSRPAAGETIVRRLSLRNGSFKVGGVALGDISLNIRELATKGSRDCRIELAFRDDARNLYTLNGKGRGGRDPAFDLEMRAPSLSLAGVAALGKLKGGDYLSQASGDLRLAATLRKGELLAHGEMGFKGVAAAKGTGPLSGRLLLGAGYTRESDQARLESLDLIVDDLLQLHATGRVSELKGGRNFELAVEAGDLELRRLAKFLPAEKRRQVALSGRVASTSLHLAGSGSQGITSITGGADLRELSLAREGRQWIGGLSSTVTIEKQAAGIAFKGDLSSSGGRQSALEAIRAPFTLVVSPRLKLQKAALSLSHARLLGVALSGEASYDISAAEPFRASLQGGGDDLATITPLLKPYGLRVDSGKGSALLKASGRDPLNFMAAVDLKVAELRGGKGESAVSLQKGGASARISRSRGQLEISGSGELKTLAAAGKSGQARLSYRLDNGLITLENCFITFDGTTINLPRLTAAIPSVESRHGAVYYPLAIQMGGGEVVHKTAKAHGVSGRMDGYLARSGRVTWLEGSAELSGGELGWQGRPVAAPRALVAFDRAGAKAKVSGTLLGGGVSGDVAFNPFAPAEGATFRVGIKGGDLAVASPLLPARSGVTVREGLLDGSMEGGYFGSDGLNARVEATGKAVTLAGSGKNLLSRAGITLAGDIAGQRISIRKAVVTAGEGLSFSADGMLENAFAGNRQGSFNFVLAQAPLNSYIDAFVNSMPRFLQEATVNGSLAAHGTLALQGGQRLLQGSLLFGRISLDSPGESVVINDMEGSFPFSIDLSGRTSAVPPKSLDFTRENFQQLYLQLDRPPGRGRIVTVGRIALGKVELGALTLHVDAGIGLTEIVAMRSSLYGGTLLGRGALFMKKGVNYRGDMLVGGLSLTELCNHFPAVKGYISGRVNGIVSLYGEGGGIPGMYGFVDLWANEAKGERMLVSREFLQRLGGKKLSGIFFRKDIPYDRAEISALLEQGYLTFDTLDIVHTNVFGVRDLNVSIAPAQNRIALDHLLDSIKQASVSGKGASGQGKSPGEAAPVTEFKWEE